MTPCTHFIAFRGDEYLSAIRAFGKPHFIHRTWDKRAQRDIAPCDLVVFAQGNESQPFSRFNGNDLDERFL